jgi:hypothetical protein
VEAWSDGIWLAEAPLRFFGLPLGTRMTVVRLPDGGLFVHSPVALTSTLAAEIDALGRVHHVVSPNELHHLWLGDAHAAWPDARLWAPPGLAQKRPELPFAAPLGDAAPDAWAGALEQGLVRGSRWMEEVVFFHPASRTLRVGDLCQHFGPESPWLTRLFAHAARMYGRPRMPPD